MKSGTSGEKDNSTCPCAATLLTDANTLYGITTFKPSEYAIEEDFPNEVVLLVRGWSVADFMSDWTKLNAVDE